MDPGRFAPIHRATWGNEPQHTAAVKVLLEAGVPHDQMTRDGFEPIDVVKENRATKDLLRKWAKDARQAKKKAKEEDKKKEKSDKKKGKKGKVEL